MSSALDERAGETPRGQPVIECRHLSKRFDDGGIAVQVLKDINLSVAQGERVAIIGRSGAGKSTLLHLLGGLDMPSGGEVWVEGNDMARLSERERGRLRNRSMGFIYQFHHLLAEFSAEENVAMPLLVRRERPEAALAKARTLLEKVGLGDRLKHKPGELSGGERQRAAVARALVTSPRCILADEPTGNLDMDTADQVHQLLVELNEEFDTSFIVVTHNLALSRLMERTYVLEHGLLGLKTVNGSNFTV
jgi:lipoprotein-releasing system ATP-binding protein